jgi:prolyl-tRNA synthetase family I
MPKQKLLGLTTKKSEDFADWYHQVLTKAELLDYHDVSGCYVLRPNSYEIWEHIKDYLDLHFKKNGVRNAYFPIFISKESLQKEKEHLEDFSVEVAWVTKAGNKILSNELAIRPTSETSMYPYFAKWLQTHRDLPIKINQWNNVVRWEFKNPTPFIRSREFLWQEGHTAHQTYEEAEKQVYDSIELYEKFYKEMLCIKVISGRKTLNEKFAGSDFTTTVEAFIPETGKGIQAATSHMLGQNFSKMFNIVYEDPEQQKNHLYVYQTSWGVTTRSIGALIMTHADDIGMVLPPKVAFYQVVIVPTGLNKKTPEDVKEKLFSKCLEYEDMINQVMGIRCHADVRDNYTPPFKYNYWEMRGIPIRIELGPRELENNKCTIVNRVSGEKIPYDIPTFEEFRSVIVDNLFKIENMLYNNSIIKLENSLKTVVEWIEFKSCVENKKMIASPFCGKVECENILKEQLTDLGELYQGVKTLCVPFEQNLLELKDKNMKCINPKCNEMCSSYTLFGKSY